MCLEGFPHKQGHCLEGPHGQNYGADIPKQQLTARFATPSGSPTDRASVTKGTLHMIAEQAWVRSRQEQMLQQILNNIGFQKQ